MALNTNQILTFKNLKGLGNVTAFKLCEYAILNNIVLNSNEDLFNFYNSAKDKKMARAMKDYTINDIIEAKNIAEEIIDNSKLIDINVVSYYDDIFPNNLKKIINNNKEVQPLILYYKGNISNILNRKAITIIGTREVTKEGVLSGDYIAKRMADEGFNIVSGLAIGCDTVAHKGALKSNIGTTTAFLAHGLDTIYPKENKMLAEEIIEKQGVLFSEYPIGTHLRGNFLVERDRLQAGLSDATLVIQTGIKGGTMHAVSTTIENKKPLYAVSYKNENLLKHEKVQGNIMLIEENKAIAVTSKNLKEVVNTINSYDKTDIKNNISHDLFSDHSLKDKIKCVIFDLDQTLVDTSKLESLRNNRSWNEISNRIHESKLYDDIKIILNQISSRNIKIAIVTSSPSSYAKQILEYFDLKYDYLLGYHDVKKRKPDPEPMLNVLDHYNLKSNEVISFGDRDIDIISSNSANIKSIACCWGTSDRKSLEINDPFDIIDDSKSILKFI